MPWHGWLFAVTSLVAALIANLARLNIPTAAFWSGRPVWIVGALIVLAIVPVGQTLVGERGERKKRKNLEFENRVREFLTAGLVAIVRETRVDATKAGVHMFLVRKRVRPVRDWRHFSFRAPRQERIAKVKLSFNPPPSGIHWTEAKGVIGQCWATRANVVSNLREEFGAYMESSEDQWNALKSNARYGLTFAEFQRTKGYFGIVAAVPVLSVSDPSKYLGCISFDAPYNAGEPIPEAILTDQLRSVARMVEELISARG